VKYLILLLLFISNAFALNLKDYAPGTFFSVLVDINSGEIYYSPTEGAMYADGRLLQRNEVVNRYGGHGKIARMNNLDLYGREIYAGGVLVGENNTHTIKFKSISVNGVRAKDYMVPRMYRNYFSQVIGQLVEEDVFIDNKRIRFTKSPDICSSFYLGL
jgi:hypothetical protein